MGVLSEITYRGDLSCEVLHGPSSTTMLTDAPVDNQGEGRWFSPTDLVGVSMGSCMVTIMGIVARRNELDITGTRVSVHKEMIADPHRRIARLEVTIAVPKPLDDRARRLMMQAAESCPVKRSLDPKVEVDLRFEWTD